MIRAGFLSTVERTELIELARNGLAEHRLARRANALVLLDRGMSCEDIGSVLLLDDDTVRTWRRLYREDGIAGLAGFGYEGSDCHLTAAQQEKLKAWVGEALPRTTRPRRSTACWTVRPHGTKRANGRFSHAVTPSRRSRRTPASRTTARCGT